MEKVAKRGDMLFVGEDEDTLAVIVLDSLEYKGDSYLKIIAIPIMVEKILDESKTDAEFAREVVDQDKYYLDPVLDPALVEILKEEFDKKHTAEKEPAKA